MSYLGEVHLTNGGAGGGIGFCGLLCIVFIVLKLLGKIDWSWWWVLSPIWISIVLVVLILGIFIWWVKR